MSIRRPFARGYRAFALTIALLTSALPAGTARAGLVTTEQVIHESTAASDRERVLTVLMRDDVRQQLEALGVDRDEAIARVTTLSDEEVRQIAARLDQLPAGQGFLAGVALTAGVVFIVLIITDLLGVTNVLAVINPIR
jgi:hypothetical protein